MKMLMLLVVNKPAGHGCASSHWSSYWNFAEYALGYGRAAASEPFEPVLIHRLDGDTSGVIAIAKNGIALDFFRINFATDDKKWYGALVRGSKMKMGKIRVGLVVTQRISVSGL